MTAQLTAEQEARTDEFGSELLIIQKRGVELWEGEFQEELEKLKHHMAAEINLAVREERERKLTYHRICGASEYMRAYGISDEDILTPGEVQELLQTFMDESLTPTSKETK